MATSRNYWFVDARNYFRVSRIFEEKVPETPLSESIQVFSKVLKNDI